MVLDQVRRVERVSVLQVKLSFDDGKTSEWYDVESLDYEYKDVTFIDGGGESVEIDYWNQPLRIKSQLNENQQIAINNSKKSFEKGADLYDCAIDMVLYDGLTDKEWAKATLAFLLWAQEQEE